MLTAATARRSHRATPGRTLIPAPSRREGLGNELGTYRDGAAMTLEQAIKHLAELADGWECGAKVEDAIVAAYQRELDAFSATPRDPETSHDIRLIRAVLNARDSRDQFRKDANAARTLLSALPPPPTQDKQP